MEDPRIDKIDSKISQMLESDIAKFIKIAGFVALIVGAYYVIQTKVSLMEQDIRFIKENHLAHIEESLKINETDHKEILKLISEINISLAKLATLEEKQK
jgi:hypothetical protein